MALPAVRKPELAQVQPKLPDIRRPLLPTAPKLEDKGRKVDLAKMEKLDLAQRRVDATKIAAKLEERRTAKLAALPRLEEVGRRQVRNLPQAIKLEEQRQEAVALKAIQSMAVTPSRRNAAPVAVLQEATPQQSSRLEKAITNFLPTAPEPVVLQPRAAEPPPIMKKIARAPPALPKRTAAVQEEQKKGVEIEGPLADRQVAAYDVPEFPAWARAQGVLEAAVSIRFFVDRDGNVMPDMRLEKSSGYGRLDRLAMDSLRNWKFAPIFTHERQWGIITFRFVLE